MTPTDRPPLRILEGCICAYAWRSLGRVYDQDMGETWVRATTERACPLHGDDRPRRPRLTSVTFPAVTEANQ
jgi:hypothetical protein